MSEPERYDSGVFFKLDAEKPEESSDSSGTPYSSGVLSKLGEKKPGFHSGNQGRERDYQGGPDYD